MKTPNNKGFTHVEMLIVFIVVAIIGAVGFYVFNNVKGRTSNADSKETYEAAAMPQDPTSAAEKTAFTQKITARANVEESGQAVAERSNCSNGSGTRGARVQMVYVTKANSDTFTQDLPQLRTIAAGVDQTFLDSAAKTGGKRQVKWARNDQCKVKVDKLIINDADFYRSIEKSDVAKLKKVLKDKGLNKDNTKYMVYIGTGDAWGPWLKSKDDNRPGPENANNETSYQIIGRPLWESSSTPGTLPSQVRLSTQLLATALGAQQMSAPHASREISGHYTDNYGILSTPAAGSATTYPCTTAVNVDYSQYNLLDCKNDDYFSANPPAGSYLSAHWNVANSKYLFTPN